MKKGSIDSGIGKMGSEVYPRTLIGDQSFTRHPGEGPLLSGES
jgi:hypothetical protein